MANAGMNLTRRKLLARAPVMVAPSWLFSCSPQTTADVVLLGGEIHTVDAGNRRVEALAIRQGKVLAAGFKRDIEKLIGPSTRRVDLAGRTVLPGINDSHLHLLGWGLSKPPFALNVTYPVVKSIADVVATVHQAASELPAGQWIVGRGWDQPYLAEGRPPTAADLDVVSPDHPVALTEFSGHAVWVNSKAMMLAGIDVNTQAPPGGVIVRDKQGHPTGLLFEGAAWMLKDKIPPPSLDQRRAALRRAMQNMLARGVTSCTVPGQSPENLRLLNELAAESIAQKLRVTGLVQAGTSVDSLNAALAAMSELAETNPKWMQMPGVKIMGDGIPTANKTAWLHEPYEGGGNGSLLLEGDSHEDRVAQLHDMIDIIHGRGLQVGTHVTGDRSIDTVVAAYQRVQQLNPQGDKRHYVIHADMVSDNTLQAMAAAQIGANFNPEIKHLIADSQVNSIGPERAAREWPYRSALSLGVNVASSSDAPVTEGNWLQGIATCMNRRGKQSGQVSGPQERISLDQAIRTYTMAGAWQDHAEHYKGSLEPGKAADVCVLDARLSALPSEQFAGVQVAMTLVDGAIVHDTFSTV
jgi:predicted amidohydrolase YtcJ